MKRQMGVMGAVLAWGLASAAAPAYFTMSAPSLKEKENIGSTHVFDGFGCTGKNLSPQIEWKNPPKDTKSFAVTMYDPDAPTGSGWWHWLVVNIPANVSKLKEGAGAADGKDLPKGAMHTRTDFGQQGYGGPCPPPGDKPHRYVLTVYALKVDKLPIEATASGAMVGFYIKNNALGESSITRSFGR